MALEFSRDYSRIQLPSAPLTKFRPENVILSVCCFSTFLVGILSENQKALEFFKNPSQNSDKSSALKSIRLRLIIIFTEFCDAVSGWAGWALVHLECGISVNNPIHTKGAVYVLHITDYLPPDLKTYRHLWNLCTYGSGFILGSTDFKIRSLLIISTASYMLTYQNENIFYF